MGQGLAGTLLSFELLEKGHKVTIIASKEIPSSSKVAAGLFNPVVFKRLVPSWRAHEFIPFLKKRYSHLEMLLQRKFLYSVPLSKLIETQSELELWLKKKGNEELKMFVKDEIEKIHISGIEQELQMGEIEESGYVHIKSFLEGAFLYFQDNTTLLQEDFDFSQLSLTLEKPQYKGIFYDALIFCEGYHVHQNPYFTFLPFKPVNGDVLTLKIPSYQYSKCFNKNFFLLPLHDGNYRLGATYNWSNLVFETNENAKNELLARVQGYIKGEITVVQHEAGVRPSSNDRRPILGAHPQHKNLYIFNGLGAKGVMLAPYFAEQLVAHITLGEAIEKEVSIERYYRLQQGL
ncbi:MAG: NAD(P)/FAD-dependent oxidoreductase [Flavobacteriales bacterium]